MSASEISAILSALLCLFDIFAVVPIIILIVMGCVDEPITALDP